MSLLSPKMASKRPSAADTVFPPKKRALYEHMKLHGIDKFSTNHISGNGILAYQENLGMFGLKIPVNLEIARAENFSRPRSDSLHSHVSSNSDNTETGSAESRENSPCTIQSLFDHHTPERNPITSLEGLKSDISKPLFPPSDSDNSMVDSEGHLSPDISLYGEEEKSKFKESDRKVTEIVIEQKTNFDSIPENDIKTFHHNETMENDLFLKESIPYVNDEFKENKKSDLVDQKQNDVYMGPMVSLLNRFNAEATRNNVGVKIKEQFPLQEMKDVVTPNSAVSRSALLNFSQQEIKPLQHIQNNAKTYIVSNEINSVPRERISCYLCSKEFTSRANLHNHMKTHENKAIPCWVCKEKFQTAENLTRHMKIEHKGENPYKCEHCSREFTQFNNLRRHMRVHREKVFKCNLCNREFNEEFYLKMHMGTHTGQRMYSCGVCGAGFPSSHDLKMHVKTHSPSLLHTCDVCGKSFSKACVLRQHKKGHSGERPHKCDKCEKTFIHRHHLTMHMKSHLDEKRLSCDICKKEFSQHSHLYKHLRAHEDMKKYGIDVESVQKTENDMNASTEEKKVSNGQVISSNPKVVMNTDTVSVTDKEVEKCDERVIKNVVETSGKTPKQRGFSNSQHSKVQHSFPINNPSTSCASNKSLPSLSQTFGQQIRKYPSMPFSPGLTHNYLHGSQAHPYPPVYNPFFRNGVPAAPHGYQSYNELYRKYSEQMQTYYNNMYMMNFLSQNAVLQKAQGGQNFQNSKDYLFQKQSESSQSLQESPSSLQPKHIKGISDLENRGVRKEKDEKSKRESGIKSAVSENEGNNDLDVVTENEDEKRQDFQKDTERNVNEATTMSEEQEIAQELLKMSAGAKIIESIEARKKSDLTQQSGISVKDKHVNGINLTHCISNIIENRTNNDNRVSENTNQSTTFQNFTTFDSILKSDKHLQLTIPKSSEQSFPIRFSGNQHHEYSSGPCDNLQSRITDVSRIGECQTSPLQKLKMFVTSEEKDFNKTEPEIDGTKNYSTAFHSHLTFDIGGRSETLQEGNNFEDKADSEYIEPGENIKLSVKSVKNDLSEAHSKRKNVEDSFEKRLEKIRQFADIGKRYGRSECEDEMAENQENKSIDNFIERTEDEFVNVRNEIREENVESVESEGEDKSVDVVDSIENAGYFDDSLEDRQLEIVETGDVTEGLADNQQFSENSEANDARTDDSTEEGYVLTENEFLRHISQMNGKSDESPENDEKNSEVAYEIRAEKIEKKGNDFDQEKDEVPYCVHYDTCSEQQLSVKTNRVEPYEKYFSGNNYEYEAVDLRTEKRTEEAKISDFCNWENDIARAKNQVNLPMDLSMSRKRKHDNGNRAERSDSDKKVELPASLTCGLCWKVFENNQQLVCHQIEHAKNIGNHCYICKKSFSGAFELQCHMLKHKNFTGSVQNEEKSTENGRFEIDEKVELCLNENTEYPHSLDIDSSERCEYQQKASNQRNEMGEKQHCGQFCDKTFDQSEDWKEHVNTHNAAEKPYVCNICQRVFSHRHNLNRHRMSHNSKSYECSICNRSFKESFYLQMHMKSHDEDKFHKCQICGQNVCKSDIWQHTSQHLGNVSKNPTYQQIGNRVQEILHVQNLKTNDHNKKVINTDKQLSIPEFTGENKGKVKLDEVGFNDIQGNEALNLKKENIENMYVQKDKKINHVDAYNVFKLKDNAPKCVSVLAESRMEEGNRNSVTKSEYKCHNCRIVLRTKHELSNHMDIHSGLRPHVCKTCGRAFKKSKGLRTHEKLHLDPSLQV